MVFYFSGTGNSEGIAKIVAERLGVEAVDIVGKDPAAYNVLQEEFLGFVFPIYAWAAPEVMLKFAKGLQACGGYTFAIATYSNVAGLALQQFAEIIPLKGSIGITMPDNYPVTERILDTPESSMEKLRLAQIRLEEMIPHIQNKEEIHDIKIGDDAEDNTYFKATVFNEKMRTTEPYCVTNGCIGCGLCEQKCPAGVIKMEDGKPVWVSKTCYLCMACLNRCPVCAIEYGPHSSGRPRYYFKGFSQENYE